MEKQRVPGTSAADRCVRRLATVAAIAAFIVLTAWTVTHVHRSHAVSSGFAALAAEPLPLPAPSFSFSADASNLRNRALYPYSVIPGGVRSAGELKTALANDSVAAAHYAGFNAAKARVVRLDAPREVYVSYRIGDRIFWTKRKLTLLKGETVITDGVNYARTRCGNRLSESPMQPVAPLDPKLAGLDEPLQAPALSAEDLPFPLPPTLPITAALDSGFAAPGFAGPAEGQNMGFGAFFIQPILSLGNVTSPHTPVIPPAGGVQPPPVIPPPGTIQPPPGAVAAPEPGALLLLSFGLAALAGLCLRRRKPTAA